MPSPDPIGEAAKYVEFLLSYLGDDDPAEAQAAAPADWRRLVAEAGADLWTRPAEGEWSAHLCLAHVTGAEVVTAARYRWIVAQDEPELIGYDQDRWVDRLHDDQADPAELLDLYEALRRANLALWARLSAERRVPGWAGTRSAARKAWSCSSGCWRGTIGCTWSRLSGRCRPLGRVSAVFDPARRVALGER